MAPNPEAFKERIETFISSWEEFAPTAKFFGMTLAQFKELMNRSLTPRAEIAAAEQQIKANLVLRDNADIENKEVLLNVVNAIKGDPNYGENSPLYAALGYVTRNQRSSGLSRASAEEPSRASADELSPASSEQSSVSPTKAA